MWATSDHKMRIHPRPRPWSSACRIKSTLRLSRSKARVCLGLSSSRRLRVDNERRFLPCPKERVWRRRSINFGVTAMERKRRKTSAEEFEKAAARRDRAKYVLRLYVAGMTQSQPRQSPMSRESVMNTCRPLRTRGDRYLPAAQAGQGRADYCRPNAHQKTPHCHSRAHRRHVGYGKVSCRHRSETKNS